MRKQNHGRQMRQMWNLSNMLSVINMMEKIKNLFKQEKEPEEPEEIDYIQIQRPGDREPIDIPSDTNQEIQDILEEVHPTITNPEDTEKLLYATNQLISQRRSLETYNENDEDTIKEYTGKQFKKGYRLGKRLENSNFPKLQEILGDNINWRNREVKKREDEQINRYGYLELSRIAFESGLIYGLFYRTYTDAVEEPDSIDKMAYQ